jgi:hypothetical protein
MVTKKVNVDIRKDGEKKLDNDKRSTHGRSPCNRLLGYCVILVIFFLVTAMASVLIEELDNLTRNLIFLVLLSRFELGKLHPPLMTFDLNATCHEKGPSKEMHCEKLMISVGKILRIVRLIASILPARQLPLLREILERKLLQFRQCSLDLSLTPRRNRARGRDVATVDSGSGFQKLFNLKMFGGCKEVID